MQCIETCIYAERGNASSCAENFHALVIDELLNGPSHRARTAAFAK